MDSRRDELQPTYDQVPYWGETIPFSHPDNLNVIAALRGVIAPAVTRCNVLEIGCGLGRNLIAMAHVLPGSSFVGFDLSPRQIAMGNEVVQKVGLKNVEL